MKCFHELLYLCRSDSEQPVRQRANITWKGLVYNSSKMLNNILDPLMHVLITSLSSIRIGIDNIQQVNHWVN